MTDLQALPDPAVETNESGMADYWNFTEVHNHYLPDGKQFISHRTLNEGKRRTYLNSTNRDVYFGGKSGNGEARMSMKPGDEKAALLKAAVCGWNLYKGGQPYPFSDRAFEEWQRVADPRVIDGLEKAIRKANPWLLAELSLEDLYKEREALDEMIAVKVAEEEGNVGSSSK